MFVEVPDCSAPVVASILALSDEGTCDVLWFNGTGPPIERIWTLGFRSDLGNVGPTWLMSGYGRIGVATFFICNPTVTDPAWAQSCKLEVVCFVCSVHNVMARQG